MNTVANGIYNSCFVIFFRLNTIKNDIKEDKISFSAKNTGKKVFITSRFLIPGQ